MANTAVNSNITPLVSVSVITYNHEKFIGEALDGILAQKTKFPIQIVLGEDCSTDNTRNICIKYKEKYPEIIRLRLADKNQGSMKNWMENIRSCTGKYIALCEGDDYWTDENKLQKQVDFLENHPDFVFSSHNSAILGHNKKMIYDPPLRQTEIDIHDLICGHWGIMTASIVFRRDQLNFPVWYAKIKNGDYALQLLLATRGNIHYIPEYMSVYRRHIGGLTAKFNPFYASEAIYKLFKYFNKETHGKYRKDIKSKLERMYYMNKDTAKGHKLKKQYFALSIVYYFSKLGIDIMPVVAKSFK